MFSKIISCIVSEFKGFEINLTLFSFNHSSKHMANILNYSNTYWLKITSMILFETLGCHIFFFFFFFFILHFYFKGSSSESSKYISIMHPIPTMVGCKLTLIHAKLLKIIIAFPIQVFFQTLYKISWNPF